MRIRLSDTGYLRDLIDFLIRAEWVTLEAAGKTVEAHLPRARNEAQARRELSVCLATWHAKHPGVEAEIVEWPARGRRGGVRASRVR